MYLPDTFMPTSDRLFLNPLWHLDTLNNDPYFTLLFAVLLLQGKRNPIVLKYGRLALLLEYVNLLCVNILPKG
jgi:hypothetical protein